MKYRSLFFIILLFIVFIFQGCQLLEPENDNHSTGERLLRDPAFAEGLLLRAYTYIPTNSYRFDEVATDDAVTNNTTNTFRRMATGEWSSNFNPQDLWTNANRSIEYINQFLNIVDSVPWKWTDEEANNLYIRRLKGESYALRGLFKYYITRNHGGIGLNGTLLGGQIFNSYPLTKDDYIKQRASLSDFSEDAYADFEKALSFLPLDYGNISNIANLPAGFSEVKNIDKYNATFGDYTQQRISGRHVLALKARLSLLLASPAFNLTNDNTLWVKAADDNAVLIDAIGGISGLDATGHIFYLKAQVDNADITSGDKKDLREILWRRPIATSRTREVGNFPPSLYGSGEINPSQNLVDAFPMLNGYPISNPNSGYDASKPYTSRDPRLTLYIVYNGMTMKGTVIKTAVGGGVNAVDSVKNSTRTGYYLKKLLREDVNANPATPSDQKHYETHIRYTEIFLNYAEAANEAWGPTGRGTHNYSAKEVIAAIRKRAGLKQPDNYLNSITDKENMRELIQNERRIELCFEGFRFWDMRRWKKNLNEPVRGVIINGNAYNYFTVEERAYDDYMYYGPIPNSEKVKFGIEQNLGW